MKNCFHVYTGKIVVEIEYRASSLSYITGPFYFIFYFEIKVVIILPQLPRMLRLQH